MSAAPRELFARLGRLQKSFAFKLGASAAIGLLAVGAVVTLYVLAQEKPAAPTPALSSGARPEHALDIISSGPLGALGLAFNSMIDSIRVGDGLLPVALVWLLIALLAGAFVWLGIGLTALALLLFGWGVAWPLMLMDSTRGVGQLLAGAVPLALAFTAGLQLARAALSGPMPLFAIARNVLNEAVRMKVSLVFIVLAIFFLAVIPGTLQTDQPLRFRIQQWLQYGTGFPYAVLALLTLFLSAASVAFEQRDRIIWQTMTKPVPPWQYILGKWLGVMSLNVVMLGVTGVGVFMFTEYLRYQPARGEIAYHVREDGTDSRADLRLMSDDRRIIETQVLVARATIQPEPIRLTEKSLARRVEREIAFRMSQDTSVRDTPELRRQLTDQIRELWNNSVQDGVDRIIRDTISRDARVQDTPALRAQIENELIESWELEYRTLDVAERAGFLFEGLSRAKATNARMNLRFKIDSGSNNPSELYRVVFAIQGAPVERQVALKSTQTMTLGPEAISDDGTLDLEVFNGPLEQSSPMNPRAFTLPPDGLQILYSVGGYESNFLRVFAVILVKLGFIAAVSICAATFLSFPVASLVALAFLIMAESGGYLTESLEFYNNVRDPEGNLVITNVIIRLIATPVAAIFRLYAELKPTSSLVDGLLISWSQLATATAIIGGWAVLALGLALAIFRKRELAMYSGH